MRYWHVSEVFADDADYLERGIKNALGINGVYERNDLGRIVQFEILCNDTEKRLINSSVYSILGRKAVLYNGPIKENVLLHRKFWEKAR
jgi:hypothetical protein